MINNDQKALDALNLSYPFEYKDGYIVVQNPDYKEDNGENPYLTIRVIDINEQLVMPDDLWQAVQDLNREYEKINIPTLYKHAVDKLITYVFKGYSSK